MQRSVVRSFAVHAKISPTDDAEEYEDFYFDNRWSLRTISRKFRRGKTTKYYT